MSFTNDIKKKIIKQKFSKKKALDFLSGVIAVYRQNDQTENQKYSIKIRDLEILNFLETLFLRFDCDVEKKNYQIIVKNFHSYINDINKLDFLSWYFAGMFLAKGSISKLEATSYHLEIQFFDLQKAKDIQEFFVNKDLNFKILKRKNKFILYLKKSEQIADFLKTIQVFEPLLIFESKRMERDRLTFLKRYVNLESYNLEKISKGYLEFEKRYLFLKEHNLFDLFTKEERIFFEIKLNNPFEPLSELVLIYNNKTKKNITKSGVNHYLIKMKKIYLKNIGKRDS